MPKRQAGNVSFGPGPAIGRLTYAQIIESDFDL
jgi:hypothetical protein